jgi:hypothetical protein
MTTENTKFEDIFKNWDVDYDKYFRPDISLLIDEERDNEKEIHQKLMLIKQFLSEHEINATVKDYIR